jgi:SAM-dependent methyltransferase
MLRNSASELGLDASLWEAGAVRRRIETLDALEMRSGPAVESLRVRLEAANSAVYERIRGKPEELMQWIEGERGAASGLSYDWRDELVSGVLALKEPRATKELAPEMVFYQPTPVRHVLELIEKAGITDRDAVVDLGSGMGHVPLLVEMLTGAWCEGIEVEGAYVACARECAERLGRRRVQFVEADARSADFAIGTVFYLYTPFTGEMLAAVLEKLRVESERRAMKVCTLGPCAEIVAREVWLRASGTVEEGRVAVFNTGR